MDIIAVESGKAVAIEKAVWTALENTLQMSKNEILPKLLGLTFDGASVNQGIKGGVVKIISDACDHIIVSIWCTPHKLELAFTDTKKHSRTDIITRVEAGVDPIYRYYYYSAKRRRAVNEIAQVLEEDSVYFSKPCGTRWMASRERAYKAVLRHYMVTVLQMEDSTQKNDEESAKCLGYLRTLKSIKFVEGLSFLIDVLGILAETSKAFQKDELLVSDVSVKLLEARLKLESMKVTKGPTYTLVQTQIDEATFKSIKLTGSPLQEHTMNTLLDDCISFKADRFAHLEQTPFKDFVIFDHRNHPDTIADINEYGNQELDNLIQYFSSVLTAEGKELIPVQWPALKSLMYVYTRGAKKSPLRLLQDLMVGEGTVIKDIMVLVRIMMTLSPFSAAVERGFSLMKDIKTNSRNKLNNEMLAHLMRVNQMNATIDTFDPSPPLARWLTATKKARKLENACGGEESSERAWCSRSGQASCNRATSTATWAWECGAFHIFRCIQLWFWLTRTDCLNS